MGYPKGSINRLLHDEYERLDPRPQPLTKPWHEFLDAFRRRHPLEVSRMRGESLEQRALHVLRFKIPDWD
jgi:hypothetical protein